MNNNKENTMKLDYTDLCRCHWQDLEDELQELDQLTYAPTGSRTILAYSGEKSAEDQGTARQIKVGAKSFGKVDRWITINNAFREFCQQSILFKDTPVNQYYDLLLKAYADADHLMKGIFTDKWDYESRWCWIKRPATEEVAQ